MVNHEAMLNYEHMEQDFAKLMLESLTSSASFLGMQLIYLLDNFT